MLRQGLKDLFVRPQFHTPAVDGLRALAITMVILFHFSLNWIVHVGKNPVGAYARDLIKSPGTEHLMKWMLNGGRGVDLFFVISGFLIGGILFKEVTKSGRVELRRFYVRRYLRLMPVYMVVLLLAIPLRENVHTIWANFLYLDNFLSPNEQYMNWTWSLAIEEQFYLVAPLLILFAVPRTRHFMVWACLLLMLGWLIRASLVVVHDVEIHPLKRMSPANYEAYLAHLYDNLYSRYGQLLLGVMAAWLHCTQRERVRAFVDSPGLASRMLLVAALAFLCLDSTGPLSVKVFELPRPISLFYFSALYRDLYAASCAVLILYVVHSSRWLPATLRKLLGSRVLYPVAQLSYSTYLVHMIVLREVAVWSVKGLLPHIGAAATFWLSLALGFLGSVVIAAMLYVLVERPFMRLRSHPRVVRWVS